jgi:regulator of CtrA degradation
MALLANSQTLTESLVDSLYAEALVLADEARSWFDRTRSETSASAFDDLPTGVEPDPDSLFHWAGRHDPSLRIALSCESLRLSTRLMHVIAWLLSQRAIRAGEIPAESAWAPHHRLGVSPGCEPALLEQLPEAARTLIEASVRLYERARQIEEAQLAPAQPVLPPVHAMLDQLARRL